MEEFQSVALEEKDCDFREEFFNIIFSKPALTLMTLDKYTPMFFWENC